MKDGPYEIDNILFRLVHYYSDAADLFKAVRKAHPDAKKKRCRPGGHRRHARPVSDRDRDETHQAIPRENRGVER